MWVRESLERLNRTFALVFGDLNTGVGVCAGLALLRKWVQLVTWPLHAFDLGDGRNV